MFGLEILKDIDKTLDKLVINARKLNAIELEDLSEEEKCAFEETQKNLLFHLFYLDKKFEEKRSCIKALRRSCQHTLPSNEKNNFSSKKSSKKMPKTKRPKKRVL